MKGNNMTGAEEFESHSNVLSMAGDIYSKVKDIHEEVDTHKRYDAADVTDPYGEVIAWTHERGSALFGAGE